MAKPFRETPTLYGEDARRLLYNMEHPEPVSSDFIKEIDEAYDYIKSITTSIL